MRYGRPIRLDPDSYSNPDTVFHLTVRTHPEVGALADATRVAIWESLMAECGRQEVFLRLAVLMPDHVHILASPGSIDILHWMGRWKSLSTRASWQTGHYGVVWQRRFHDRALRGQKDFEAASEYILGNPMAAGLVEDADDWPHRWAAWFEA